jgi:short-subunit dehydrogenase
MMTIIILFMTKTMITGASSGLGSIYAERFAKRGHDLVLVARDKKRLEALAERLGGRVEVVQADLTKPADLATVEAKLKAGDIDILVNNAGATTEKGFESPEPLFNVVDLNVVAFTRLAAAAVTGFRKAKRKGSIINIGSIVGFVPELFTGVYGATKAYVYALSRSMQNELKDEVYVQAVLPAATRTEIWERSGRDVNTLPVPVMEADELVDAALVGFDRKELVTIPPLHDESLFTEWEKARAKMGPNLGAVHPAARYL